MSLFDYAADFPLLKKRKPPFIFFDNGATTLKPKVVIDRITTFYSDEYATVHRGVYELSRDATLHFHHARECVRGFLNAKDVEEIVFTRGTTASLNLVARAATKAFLRAGDTILLTEIEHHSNLVPWQMIAKEHKVRLKFIPVNERGEIVLEAYEKLLREENVKLVSFAHISNVIGVRHPAREMIAMAHKAGAKSCLDGAQSAPHLAIDVQDLGCDFYAFSGHKCYGPTGVGVLYGKKEWLEEMEPIDGGGDMIEEVSLEKTTYAKAPMKFEAGTPMIAEVIGLGSALQYLSNIGLNAIEKYEEELTRYALEKLQTIPQVHIIGLGATRGAIISFVIEDLHPLDVATLLDCKGIAVRTGHLCSQPAMKRFNVSSMLRISFGLYNTKSEIDQFIESLQSVILFLRSTEAK